MLKRIYYLNQIQGMMNSKDRNEKNFNIKTMVILKKNFNIKLTMILKLMASHSIFDILNFNSINLYLNQISYFIK